MLHIIIIGVCIYKYAHLGMIILSWRAIHCLTEVLTPGLRILLLSCWSGISKKPKNPNRLLLYQVKINLFCWRYHPLCIKNLQNLYWNWPSILYSGELYSTRMWEMQATKREKQLIILSSCEAHEPQKWPSWQKLCKGTVVIFVSWKQLSKWTQGPLHRRESWLVL